MSVSGRAREARDRIMRSNRLFVDTRTLQYSAGIAQSTELQPGPVLELLEANELQIVKASPDGTVVMELTPAVFQQVAEQRISRSKRRRNEWVHLAGALPSGPNTGTDAVKAAINSGIALPVTGALLSRLCEASITAAKIFEQNPSRVGFTMLSKGFLVPMGVLDLKLREFNSGILMNFESVDLHLRVNISNGRYSFGTFCRGTWLGTESMNLSDLLTSSMDRIGKLVGKNVVRLVDELQRHPLILNRIPHKDEEDDAVGQAALESVEHECEEKE